MKKLFAKVSLCITLMVNTFTLSPKASTLPTLHPLSDSTIADTPALSDAELAKNIESILHSLLHDVHIILARIDKLPNIEHTIKEHNTQQLIVLQEKLTYLKDTFNLHLNNREKLLKILDILYGITHKLNEGLKHSFKKEMSLDKDKKSADLSSKPISFTKKLSSNIKRALSYSQSSLKQLTDKIASSFKKITTKKTVVKKQLSAEQQKLADAQKEIEQANDFIQNLGKTAFSKAYLKFHHWLNNPLFTIEPLGNLPITPFKIIEKVGLYGLNTAVAIYCVDEELVKKIPFTWMRNGIMSAKGFLGKKATTDEIHNPKQKDASIEADTWHKKIVIPSNNTKGDKSAIIDYVPLEAKPKTVEVAFEDGTQETIDSFDFFIKDSSTPIALDPNTCVKIGTFYKKQGSDILFYKRNGKNFWGGSVDTYLEGNEENWEPCPIDVNPHNGFKPVNPKVGINSFNSKISLDHDAMNLAKSTEFTPGTGFFGTATAATAWFANFVLDNNLSIPAGWWLGEQVKNDAKFLYHQWPNIKNWAHAKMSGTQPQLESYFSTSKITFADVIGRDYIKEKLQPYVDFVKNPKLALQNNIKVPRGIIFAGEPQTGKTMMAQALLGELTQALKAQHGENAVFKMITAKVHHIMKDGLGAYIEFMKKDAPCIVFCDEFELTGATRKDNTALLAEFLTALSGFDTNQDNDQMVFFLVATNHPENIDHALIEPGRMGTHIYFEVPNSEEREVFFRHQFKQANILDLSHLNIADLVQQTAACSYGTLGDIMSGIKRRAEESKSSITQEHINATIDDIIHRIVANTYPMPDDKKLVLASRYGAQAFTSLYLNPNKKFVGATIYKITPQFNDDKIKKHFNLLHNNYSSKLAKKEEKTTPHSMVYGGFFSYDTYETFELTPQTELLKLCKVALAGVVGQQVLDLDYVNFSEDKLLAQQYARAIVMNGMQEDFLPEAFLEEKKQEAVRLLQECEKEVKLLLTTHLEEYKKIVDLLQARFIIRTSDIKECFNLTSLDLSEYFATLKSPTKQQEENDDFDLFFNAAIKEKTGEYTGDDGRGSSIKKTDGENQAYIASQENL